MNPPFTFNSRSLNTIPGFIIRSIVLDPPTRELQVYPVAYGDGNIPAIERLTSRRLVVRGDFKGKLVESQATMNTFNSYLVGVNKLIAFEWSGINVTANGSIESVSYGEYSGGHITTTVVFVLHTPFVYGTTNITYTLTNQTTIPQTQVAVNEGAFYAEPTITITLDSFTGSGVQEMQLTIDNVSCFIQREFTAADVIVVDSSNKTVKANGVDIEFTGRLPIIPVGSWPITYYDTFSARQVDINITYKKRY